ncbi:AP endonuclease 2 [Pacmanvirus A23]|uniref:AP endonuclease 2 n=1 Tax=Pacmanvirus A23 TaxID=1932881 RepID=UPI000A094FDA|nr:AP endonuclease 2 [Pacmanvirus A23]SIP86119.1 AP endonuclease 2 [Pacmanvirus A23]
MFILIIYNLIYLIFKSDKLKLLLFEESHYLYINCIVKSCDKMTIGVHVSKTVSMRDNKKKTRKMSEALQDDLGFIKDFNINSPCAQIFVTGPQNYHETMDEEEKNKVRKFIKETGTDVVIHGAYVDFPWKLSYGSIHNIKQEMKIAAHIGATGVVIHLGHGAFSDDVINNVLTQINKLPDNVLETTVLWLEINAAKSSETTYETPEKLLTLFNKVSTITKNMKLKVGLCIDTAHLYACGISLDTYNKAQQWIEALPDVPIMMHLNDSGSVLGSGKDLHAELAKGNIWKAYHPETGHLPFEDSGLCFLLLWAEQNNIMTILERDSEGAIHDLMLITNMGYFID